MAYIGTFLFRSTDTGAPALGPTAGTLNALLQAVFVDGYNTQTALALAFATGVATVTKAAHGYLTGQVIRHTGFADAAFNIDIKVTVTGSGTYTFPVAGTPPASDSGGTAKVCPLDWTAYSGTPVTNVKAWQQPAGTNQFWLAISDTGTTFARAKGYETMGTLDSGLSDSVGVGFPLTSQLSGGLTVNKSNSGNAVWTIVSNRKMLHAVFNHTTGSTRTGFSFGDCTSYRSTTDNFCTVIAASYSDGGGQAWVLTPTTTLPTAPTNISLYIARKYDGTGVSIYGFKPAPSYAVPSGGVPGTGIFTYSAPVSGGMMMQRIVIAELSFTQDFRGHMPGLWFPWHTRPLTHADTFTGAVGSSIAGRTFFVVAGPSDGQVFFETSDTWD